MDKESKTKQKPKLKKKKHPQNNTTNKESERKKKANSHASYGAYAKVNNRAGVPGVCPAGRDQAAMEAESGGAAEPQQDSPTVSFKTHHQPCKTGHTFLACWFCRLRQSSPIRSGRPNQNEILFSLHCPQIGFQSDCFRR